MVSRGGYIRHDSGLEESDIINEQTGLIMGSGGPSTRALIEAADITRSKGPKRVGPFAVPKAMSSTNSATLATPFGIKGINYSISSACATSSHCIGNAYEMIQYGKRVRLIEALKMAKLCVFFAASLLIAWMALQWRSRNL